MHLFLRRFGTKTKALAGEKRLGGFWFMNLADWVMFTHSSIVKPFLEPEAEKFSKRLPKCPGQLICLVKGGYRGQGHLKGWTMGFSCSWWHKNEDLKEESQVAKDECCFLHTVELQPRRGLKRSVPRIRIHAVPKMSLELGPRCLDSSASTLSSGPSVLRANMSFSQNTFVLQPHFRARVSVALHWFCSTCLPLWA